MDYSPNINSPRRFAPASTHNFASSLILERMLIDEACLLRNTRAFHSFQISQEVRRTREVIALRFIMPALDMWRHHSVRESVGQGVRSRCCSPSHSFKELQILVVKRQ